jgi:hypothetical protein
MTPTRLLIVALLLCPIALFSQDQQGQSSNGPSIAIVPPKAPDTLSEPWRIIPPQFNLNKPSQFLVPRAGSEIASLDDSMCYNIRSYVVARDSKYSDSVHPVKYTTCVPASRYQLKTTEMREIVPQKDKK